jgi:hypothetical protein
MDYWRETTFSIHCRLLSIVTRVTKSWHLSLLCEEVLKVTQVLLEKGVLCPKCSIIKFQFVVLLLKVIELNFDSFVVSLLLHSRSNGAFLVLYALFHLLVFINVKLT